MKHENEIFNDVPFVCNYYGSPIRKTHGGSPAITQSQGYTLVNGHQVRVWISDTYIMLSVYQSHTNYFTPEVFDTFQEYMLEILESADI